MWAYSDLQNKSNKHRSKLISGSFIFSVAPKIIWYPLFAKTFPLFAILISICKYETFAFCKEPSHHRDLLCFQDCINAKEYVREERRGDLGNKSVQWDCSSASQIGIFHKFSTNWYFSHKHCYSHVGWVHKIKTGWF